MVRSEKKIFKNAKHKKKMNDAFEDRVFYTVINLMLVFAVIIIGIPLIYVVAASFSSPNAVISGKVLLWPVEFNLEGYKAVFQHKLIVRSYLNSLFYMVVGTFINVVLTLCAAYPLSRKDLPGGKGIMLLFTFTMIFTGGLIPTYLLVSNLHMLDTVWAIIIPNAISVYNMIVVCTFIKSNIPRELMEAAQVDGCGDFKFFTKFVIPLSKPVIAVITLYYAISYWNMYFHALIYLRNENLYPLQIVLKDILVSNKISANMVYDSELAAAKEGLSELLKYSLIIVSVVPVLIIYPFVQKYFVQGVMIGSIKG